MNRIHLVSGPRNISTALMYSFGNRADMSIVDEPFYATYLENHPEIDHPGRQDVLKSMSVVSSDVIDQVILGNYNSPSVFFKNMAHHLHEIDWSFMNGLKNLFLIRHPRQLITSFAKVIPNPTLLDIGLKLEFEILQHLLENGKKIVVIDSATILNNPEKALNKLCATLEILFDRDMLSWTAGPRNEDGVWAPYWYSNVHKSTGFEKREQEDQYFAPQLEGLLKEALPYYERMKEYEITI